MRWPAALLCVTIISFAAAEEIVREGEAYDRFPDGPMQVDVFPRETTIASGGRIVGVRSAATIYPTWVEYDVTVAGGLYNFTMRVGGNGGPEAALVSIDGGKPALIDYDPRTGTALPGDLAAQNRLLEQTFREDVVGSVELAAGRHRVRITHAGRADRSIVFAFDWLKLTSVAASDAPRLDVGDQPEPETSVTAERPGPVLLRLLSSYRYWGPEEAPCYGLMLYNREGPATLAGTLEVTLQDGAGKPVRTLEQDEVTLPRGEARVLRLALPANACPRGSYTLQASLRCPNQPPLTDSADLVISDLNTPGWVKRAAPVWGADGFSSGANVRTALNAARKLAEQGVTLAILCNGTDWLGGEAMSYPFRSDEQSWRQWLDGVQDLGMCQAMYHTMVTLAEHFYFEHRDFWNGKPPFYLCSWLSIYPDSPQWNRYQAADFAYFLREFPLDGIFLDNADASTQPDTGTPEADAGIARHMSGLRHAIKQANPTGILYPNYGMFKAESLRTVGANWDAHMLECFYPAPQQWRQQMSWTVQHFVEVASRLHEQTGKPFWPLGYPPDQYKALTVAACVAGRANPCGSGKALNAEYLHFMHDVQEYVYADDVFPAPAGTVTLGSNSPDLAATALVKLYPSGTRDWVFQIVNGTERDGKLGEREVEVSFDLPASELQRPAWLLQPGAERAQPLQLANPLKLRVGVWTVIIIAEELLPRRATVTPACLRPVPGETLAAEVALRSWTAAPVTATAQLADASGLLSSDRPRSLTDGVARLRLTAAPNLPPGNRELSLQIQPAGSPRVFQTPVLARVRPRLEVSLHPDHFAVFPEGRPTSGKTMLRLTNHTSHPVQGEVTLSAPSGWTARPERPNYALAPGATTEIPCDISWPLFQPESLYDVHDVELTCRAGARTPPAGQQRGGVQAPALQRLQRLPIRLHMPTTSLLYCTLGTRPLDVIRNGATPDSAPLSSIIFTVSTNPIHMDDALAAVTEGLRRQRLGVERVVLWFRTGGGKGSDQLADPQVQAGLAEFMRRGGGVILQENIFRDSVANRALLKSDLCPVGEAYQATNIPGGDWSATEPDAPAISRFVRLARLGQPEFGIVPVSQPLAVKVGVKPWAQVVARNAQGDPAIVVSTDPLRPVVYLAGALEGTYMNNRVGVNEYPEQMTHLTYFYAELARWLSVFGGQLW